MVRKLTWIGVTLALAGAAYSVGRFTTGGTAPLGEPDESGGVCEHRVARSICPFCRPVLLETEGFCAEHGVPEAICTRCNSSLIPAFQARHDWCAEHELPESQCLICNPGLAAGAPSNPTSDAVKEDQPYHVVELSDQRRSAQPPAVACTTDRLRVHFRNAEVAQHAGLGLEIVKRRPITHSLTCNAEIAYDAGRYARLSARVRGIVQTVRCDLGQRVEKGAVLLVIDSADLAAAKAEFLQMQALVRLAEATHSRSQRLHSQGSASDFESLQVETELAERQVDLARAEQKLRNLGLDSTQIERVTAEQDTGSQLDLTASFGGTVVERLATTGELAEAAQPLITIADTSRFWCMIDVAETDARRVTVGAAVVLTLDALPGESFGAKIDWIHSELDPKTRTLRARANVENRNGLLRANMFGRANVTVHESEQVVVVPRDAVQWEGCCNVVFVQENELVYRPQKVRLGCAINDLYEVQEGLHEGDRVVAQGSFLLKTEILKGNLGAGCCETGAPKQ